VGRRFRCGDGIDSVNEGWRRGSLRVQRTNGGSLALRAGVAEDFARRELGAAVLKLVEMAA
jgi:hypothetical protein